jgi:hypothetical protein
LTSKAEPALDLGVVEALTRIELRETLLCSGEKVEALDRVFDAGILWRSLRASRIRCLVAAPCIPRT